MVWSTGVWLALLINISGGLRKGEGISHACIIKNIASYFIYFTYGALVPKQ